MKKTRRRMSAAQRNANIVGYLFILPNFLSVMCFLFIPLLYSFAISFFDFNLFKGFEGSRFVGLENYIRIFSDEKVGISLLNNLKYIAGTIPISLFLAMVLAVVLHNKIFFRNVARAVFFLPYIASAAAMAMVWMRIFSPTMGLINGILEKLGVQNPPGWLASETWVWPALILMAIWGGLGYNIVLYMAGLQGIDPCLYESADIDGATFWQKFRHITVPLLSPTTFFLLITGIIGSFQVFGSINIMTRGGPGTASYVIAYYTYVNAFQYYKMGYASATSWLLIAIILIVTLLQWVGQKKWVNY